MKNKLLILMFSLFLLVPAVMAVDITENTLYHPSNTTTFYRASANMTGLSFVQVTNTTLNVSGIKLTASNFVTNISFNYQIGSNSLTLNVLENKNIDISGLNGIAGIYSVIRNGDTIANPSTNDYTITQSGTYQFVPLGDDGIDSSRAVNILVLPILLGVIFGYIFFRGEEMNLIVRVTMFLMFLASILWVLFQTI